MTAPDPALLGIVLAGGQSRRFGSDKALAQLGGQSLLSHAAAQVARWCGAVGIVGRSASDEALPTGTRFIADWPRPHCGPLGGIAGALRGAQTDGFDGVLTVGVDTLGLPRNLPTLLAPAPAYVASQPVVGLWPVSALTALEAILTGDGKASMLRFANEIGARAITLKQEPANINTPADLDGLADAPPRR